MAMAALAQAAVFGAASGIALQGGQSPMIGDILEAAAGGQATHDELAFTGLSGDRGDAAQASQDVVISASQGIPCLCEQRGDGDPAGSWRGREDGHVALLWLLPRLAAFRGGQVSAQLVQLCTRRAQLAIAEGEVLGRNRDMRANRLGGSRRQRDRKST